MDYQENKIKYSLDISWATVSKISFLIIGFYFLYRLRDVVVWFLFSLIIATLFNFLIDFLQKKRIPRVLGTIFVYFSVFGLLSYFVYLTAPMLLSEIGALSQNIPKYLAKISPVLEKFGIEAFKSGGALTQTLNTYLQKASENIFSSFVTIFGGVSSAFFIFTFAFFLSLEERMVEKTLEFFSPARFKKYFLQLWPKCQSKVSEWFLTRLIGCLFVGSATYLLLFFLHSKYTLLFSLIAGVLDFIVIIGPTVAGIVMALITAGDSISQAIFVLIGFIVIQQLENNLLFPILFKKFMGLPPFIVVIALTIGGKLWGVMGAVLAIPLAGILYELLKEYFNRIKQKVAQEPLPPSS